MTTANDRANRRKNRDMGGEKSSENEENKKSISDSVTTEQAEGGADMSDNQAVSIVTETIEICNACKKPTESETPIVVCRLCSYCFCKNCIDLLPSTFADIEKTDNLVWLCDNCVNVAIIQRSPNTSAAEPSVSPESVNGHDLPHDVTPPLSRQCSKELVGETDSTCVEQKTLNAQLTQITNALNMLQTEVCNMKNEFTKSANSTKFPNKSKKNIAKPNEKKPYAEVAKDPNAPPAVINVIPEEIDETANDDAQKRQTQTRRDELLQGRQLVPRPNTAPELLEEREIERRKHNIIVQNLIESTSSTPEERKKHDKMEVLCMLAAMRSTDIEVKAVVRLGKKSEDKPRPLMVTLGSPREPVLRKAWLIRRYRDWQKVFIDPDRSPMQQDQFKELRSEFRRRKEAGEDIIMRNGEIINATRRSSVLDLETLISDAEASKVSETTAEGQSEISTQPQNAQGGENEGQNSSENPDANKDENTASEQETTEKSEQ